MRQRRVLSLVRASARAQRTASPSTGTTKPTMAAPSAGSDSRPAQGETSGRRRNPSQTARWRSAVSLSSAFIRVRSGFLQLLHHPAQTLRLLRGVGRVAEVQRGGDVVIALLDLRHYLVVRADDGELLQHLVRDR